MISWWGALIGLALAIFLILRKLDPVYSLLLGAIVGAIIGGAGLEGTINILVKGEQSVMGTVLRVLAAGMLAGVMMDSGAAETLARTIVNKFGDRLAIFALALATMVITAVGVFIPVAVLIVAPIALEVGRNMLSQVMIADFIPAVIALIVTVVVARMIRKKGRAVLEQDLEDSTKTIKQSDLPTFKQAIVAPVIAIVLLLLGPIGTICHLPLLAKVNLDATYVLPFAAIIGALAMGKGEKIKSYAQTGVSRMTGVVMILIGAGAIGATITASTFPELLIDLIKTSHVPGVLLAPLSGILMAGATASTSTGVILATGSFAKSILGFGVAPLAAAAMVHTGAIVIDQLPQGNYFHVTANAMHMDIKERSQGIFYEFLVGGSAMLTATILYGFLHLL